MSGETGNNAGRRHRGELFAALVAMGFGSAYVATSFALQALQPVPAAVWRCALATLFVGAVLVGRGRRGVATTMAPGNGSGPDPSAREPDAVARGVRLLVLAFFAGPLFLASMNLAVAHVGAAIAAFVAGLYAVLSAVLAPLLLPERLTLRALAGFVLALGGTALLSELGATGVDLEGMAWGLLAATSFALYLVLARRWSAAYRLDGLTVAFANVALATLVLGAFVLASDPTTLLPVALRADTVVAIGWLAAVAALGPVLTVASVRLIPAARTAGFLLLNPITATVLAVVLLGERPTPLQVAGGVLVLLGMAAATADGRSRLRRS